MADEPLKPCPFCGSSVVEVVEGAWLAAAVRCGGCGVEGPGADDPYAEAGAIAAWNCRAATMAPSNDAGPGTPAS